MAETINQNLALDGGVLTSTPGDDWAAVDSERIREQIAYEKRVIESDVYRLKERIRGVSFTELQHVVTRAIGDNNNLRSHLTIKAIEEEVLESIGLPKEARGLIGLAERMEQVESAYTNVHSDLPRLLSRVNECAAYIQPLLTKLDLYQMMMTPDLAKADELAGKSKEISLEFHRLISRMYSTLSEMRGQAYKVNEMFSFMHRPEPSAPEFSSPDNIPF